MRSDAAQRSLSHEIWLEDISSSSFGEEGDTAVREEKMLGLHCVVVERLPLYDDFAMFSPEGDAHVRAKVRLRADDILSQLDGSETRDELGRILWGDEWSSDWPNREFCLQALGISVDPATNP